MTTEISCSRYPDTAAAYIGLTSSGEVTVDVHQGEDIACVNISRASLVEALEQQGITLRENSILDFINQRSEYVTAVRNSGGDAADYYRWQGHMEARRQLAEKLGYTVPYEAGDRTEPKATQ